MRNVESQTPAKNPVERTKEYIHKCVDVTLGPIDVGLDAAGYTSTGLLKALLSFPRGCIRKLLHR